MTRVMVHLFTACLQIPAGQGHLSLFQALISKPNDLVGTFLPAMPESILATTMKVLGGRWWRCSNGHAYYVDKCGRPTKVQRCMECGVKIGGTNHNALPGQHDVDPDLEGNENYSQVSFVSSIILRKALTTAVCVCCSDQKCGIIPPVTVCTVLIDTCSSSRLFAASLHFRPVV